MDRLTIPATSSSPYIDFNPETRIFEIKGESYPENCSRFYSPVMDWLRNYLGNSNGHRVELNMEILYFNSSTSKTFMDLFDLLDEEVRKGKNIVVNWRYHEENETALECGEEFKEDVRYVFFNLVEFSD